MDFQEPAVSVSNQCRIPLLQIVWETQNGIIILVGQTVLQLYIGHINILYVLINNLRTAWPTKIWMPSLSFSPNFLQDAFTSFQERIDN